MDKKTLEKLDDEDWDSFSSPIVFSARFLTMVGKCCGKLCLNCPYDPKFTLGNENIHINFQREIPS